MSGQVRFIHNSRNLLSAAILAATNTQSSSAFRRTAVSRTGSGVIGLSGPYTGTAETDIDIEITAGSGAERISNASFQGVGTGEMSDLAAQTGATPQTYTVTLIDIGTTTAASFADLEGVTLRAKSTGAGGNAINLTVDQSGLTYTPTSYSLIEDLAADAEEVEGTQWDWGTAAGIGDEIPSSAKRVVIGDDRSTVYRQWKTYTDGAWRYRFLPAIARDYKAGERVYEVSGSRSATLTDGVTPEVYTSIVTLYDLLVALRDGSDLVDVDGVIAAAATADNPAAVVDLRTRTDARVDYTSGDGSEHARGFIRTTAGAAANTEIVTARCYANSRSEGAGLGRERWKLDGSVSGDLGEIVTGAAYVAPSAAFSLTIPSRLPDGYGEPRGDIGHTVDYVSRGEGAEPPPICVDRLRLGSNAEDKSITFVYRERPSTACACEDTAWDRLQNAAKCLGIDPTEDNDLSTLAAGHAGRVSDVQRWHADFVDANTSLDTNSELRSAIHDIALADGVRATLLSVLARIYLEGILSWSAWSASTAITAYEVREPVTANGYKYRAQGAGTTAASEPTWPTTIGNTVVDSGVTWECISKTPEEEFDDLLGAIDTDLTSLEAIETDFTDYEALNQWTIATAYTRGDLIRESQSWTTVTRTDTLAGNVFVCVDGGTSASAFGTDVLEPGGIPLGERVRFGELVQDGTVQWMCLGSLPYWSNSDINETGELSGDAAATGMSASVENFLRRYDSAADFVLAAAEVTPDFNQASTTGTLPGGACWQDPGDAYWWEADGTPYLPAFTNREYVSVITPSDPDEPPQPTHEFGFVIKVECPSSLLEGDTVTITIGAAGWPATYQIDDRLYLATVSAAPLYLGGGVTGTDTYTWQVVRSVDGLGTDYTQALASPALYSDGDVEFRINAGGIAHTLGDAFTLCVEDTTFKWRQDGGAWSSNLDIAQTVLADGLKAEFTEGTCPSFESGDTASFTALQPYAIGQADDPDDQAFAWTGTGTVITASVTGSVDALMIARHTLPSGCTINVSDGASLNQNLTWRAGPIVLLLASALTNPSLTITITNATDASIGWLWAGEALSTSVDPLHTRKRSYRMSRGSGINPVAALQGRGIGFSLDYAILPDSDFGELVDMFEDIKADSDAPVCLVPGEDGSEAELVTAPDEIDYDDFMLWGESVSDRAYTLQMEFAPWLTAL